MVSLDAYRKKRDFSTTSEPKGRKSRKAGNSFVIHKHAASRLHYDLRLEMDGVLVSWAVTKGPSLNPDEKRLAVHVEDHPLAYGAFEGTIPKGQYGAGAVIIWDRGTWTSIGDARAGMAKGHLEFQLSGQKLTGRWHLVRMQGKPQEKRENWLMIKADDDAAMHSGDILHQQPESVASRRSVEQVAQGMPAPRIKAVPLAPLPDFVPPALATLRAKPPAGPDWLHEIKFDGYRLQVRINDKNVRLSTRGGLDWTARFGPRIVAALRGLSIRTALLDGELVVEGNGGASDFSALQADLSEGRQDRFALYLFDLLHLDGRDMRKLPLTERKAALEKLIPPGSGLLRFSGHFPESGAMVLRHACRLSLEGIVSKRADAAYPSGRSKAWIKSKCSARQEFVIGGYTLSSSSDRAVGSLVLGVNEGGGLRHVGRVGTGFPHKVALDLAHRLRKLQTRDSPFETQLDATARRNVRYVQPELVAEVEFRAWTADGHLRHASFRGLREDKPATQIVRESALIPARPPRRRVTLTHPDRVYWPDSGVTKENLADYYAAIWPRIAPFITGRPLALLRCPTGITGQTFFQKHGWKGMNKHIATAPDPKNKLSLLLINDLDGLMGLVQSAALEIHPWGAAMADLEHPDQITMDLDPGDGVAWEAITAAAQEVRMRLQRAGLEAFVKTSGGKGLHVVSPLRPKASWAAVKRFTKAMADGMAADDPGRYVATVAKSKRKGRILLDYLRNQRGATAVAAYSSRARAGAPVSLPLEWEELDGICPDQVTVTNAVMRIDAQDRDPWQDFRKAAAALPARN